MSAIQVFLSWSAVRAPMPFALCADVRRLVARLCDVAQCRRCGTYLNTTGKVNLCFVRDGCLCFGCYHRTRWPRAA